MSQPRGALRNSTILAGTFIFSLLQVFFAWRALQNQSSLLRDPVRIFPFAAAAFVAIFFSVRSPFWGDRLVFGIASACFLLRLWIVTVLPSGPTMYYLQLLVVVLWLVAILAQGAILLVRKDISATGKNE